jgi:hypothetical protein
LAAVDDASELSFCLFRVCNSGRFSSPVVLARTCGRRALPHTAPYPRAWASPAACSLYFCRALSRSRTPLALLCALSLALALSSSSTPTPRRHGHRWMKLRGHASSYPCHACLDAGKPPVEPLSLSFLFLFRERRQGQDT